MNRQEVNEEIIKPMSHYLNSVGIVYGRDWMPTHAQESPYVVSVVCQIEPSQLPLLVKSTMLEQLSLFLKLDGHQSVRSSRGPQGTFVFEIPKKKADKVPLRALKAGERMRIPVGLNTWAKTEYLDFSSPETSHALIAGSTGSGKTNILLLLIYFLARQNQGVEFVVINTVKPNSDLKQIENLANRTFDFVTTPEDARQVLRWAIGEAKRREEEDDIENPLFLVIDEAEDLLEMKGVSPLVRKVARSGRASNVHLILVANNPVVDNLGSSDIKRNTRARLVGSVDSVESARVATGMPYSGANYLSGPGDMLAIRSGVVNRIAVPEMIEIDLPQTDEARMMLGNLPGYKYTPGRKDDPIDYKVVAQLLIYLERCQKRGKPVLSASSLGRKMNPSMYAGKMERHLRVAQVIFKEQSRLGYLR